MVDGSDCAFGRGCASADDPECQTVAYNLGFSLGAISAITSGQALDQFDPGFDQPTANTNNWSATLNSEGDARNLARTKVGRDPIEVEPGKWHSRDGSWQYRAKPGDIAGKHIHLEELNPVTSEVIQKRSLSLAVMMNKHLRLSLEAEATSYPTQRVIGLRIRDESIGEWTLGLCLLQEE
jgi:hypothetical protein